MKRIIDKETYFFIRDDFTFDAETEIGLEVEPARGLYKAKWEAGKWVEGSFYGQRLQQDKLNTMK